MAQRNPLPRSPSSRDRQPRTFRLTLSALLSLPHRLCNPPPAVGKVRSCKVTPMFKVKLDDVLNRKHLPPLGIKDFEEWLLFVEGCPENLYFILWLKEYATRYDQWVAQTRPAKADANSKEQYRFSNQVQHSTGLTLFYLRAKQTFFTPGAEYELNIPSDVLSPFHTGHFVSPHPDPIVFSEVAWQVHNMLKESLDRFVLASYYNVGTNRALCGMIGGVFITLAGSVPPIAVNFADQRARWLRLLALPGLWLGLTVLVASMHGVCMMVYIFGDLRQLRKFELSRPRISPPKPLDSISSRPPISSPVPMYKSDSHSSSSFLPSYALRRPRPTPAPPPKRTAPPLTVTIPEPPPATAFSSLQRDSLANSIASTPYDSASQYSSSTSSYNGAIVDGADPEITVSPAYFDPDPAPEGPATRTGPDAHPFITDGIAVPSPSYRFGTATVHSEECRFNRTCYNNVTAGFIAYDDDDLYDRPMGKATEEGRAGGFDFDSLPVRDGEDAPCICTTVPAAPSSVALPLNNAEEEKQPELIQPSSSPLPAFPAPVAVLDNAHPSRRTELKSPATFIGHVQSKCSRNSVVGFMPALPANQKYKSQAIKPRVAPHAIENQHHRVRRVPAFGPLTRVLSPVVTRAQWEIVVRSGFVALLISLVIVGCLLPVPVRR
ncbi:hypothetical protein B0F90DRAFT_1254829 [Multifurca ochricompacta]|uniref:Uncharacterized protein n=1 Tax=Multifurca ochricompacta TaxID=376703 RepID=A0AAD4M9B1_9AGAM|nr:hypothetical protein B0F90DRAFT_1254829 [Multifurca ochricompacta]